MALRGGVDADDRSSRATARARVRTEWPSPVPTSTITRSARAICWCSYPTSTSRVRRPMTSRMGRSLHSGREPADRSLRARDRVRTAWDPRALDVAATVIGLVREQRPDLSIEHIGSTAVPGLPGKGIVDLAIATTPDDIPVVADAATTSASGRSPARTRGRRPGRCWSARCGSTTPSFRLHVHVVPEREELARDVAFRDALRADPELVAGLRGAEDRASWRAG